MKTLDYKNNTEMVTEFIDSFIANLIHALGIKSFKIKLLYSFMFTIMLSPVIYISDFIKDFLIPEKYFFQTVIFLCFADALMGIAKSFKLGRFNVLLLLIGLATKLGVSYVVVQVFQALSSPPELVGSPDVRNYFILTWKLLVMTYPAISAFNNIFYLTGGKFPPVWWMKNQAEYQKTGNLKKILGDSEKNLKMNNNL